MAQLYDSTSPVNGRRCRHGGGQGGPRQAEAGGRLARASRAAPDPDPGSAASPALAPEVTGGGNPSRRPGAASTTPAAGPPAAVGDAPAGGPRWSGGKQAASNPSAGQVSGRGSVRIRRRIPTRRRRPAGGCSGGDQAVDSLAALRLGSARRRRSECGCGACGRLPPHPPPPGLRGGGAHCAPFA